jgi:hypothetical protein
VQLLTNCYFALAGAQSPQHAVYPQQPQQPQLQDQHQHQPDALQQATPDVALASRRTSRVDAGSSSRRQSYGDAPGAAPSSQAYGYVLRASQGGAGYYQQPHPQQTADQLTMQIAAQQPQSRRQSHAAVPDMPPLPPAHSRRQTQVHVPDSPAAAPDAVVSRCSSQAGPSPDQQLAPQHLPPPMLPAPQLRATMTAGSDSGHMAIGRIRTQSGDMPSSPQPLLQPSQLAPAPYYYEDMDDPFGGAQDMAGSAAQQYFNELKQQPAYQVQQYEELEHQAQYGGQYAGYQQQHVQEAVQPAPAPAFRRPSRA